MRLTRTVRRFVVPVLALAASALGCAKAGKVPPVEAVPVRVGTVVEKAVPLQIRNVGTVGGGASWRMIVDFGHLDQSVGVYPGGQSENPESPFYNDQMSLWAKGEYVPLNMVSDVKKLPAQAKVKTMTFRRL